MLGETSLSQKTNPIRVHLCEVPRESNSQKQSRRVGAGCGELLFNGNRVSALQDKCILEILQILLHNNVSVLNIAELNV